ncbi:hypothetical protein ABL78_8109 [Leptomonas seymouri]|uniref:Uncharacterized protein n=1 Tax=Leptomonas seymouri TaxID=5684 RepID=A0A0N0P2F0_LEPSE|nr:hypothetical protein ABL78_8109 [Leptomonas seymouri]|eukprot:KPI82876.1 hypothetical protein ABL78_8109 [Leptomonas seymouri]
MFARSNLIRAASTSSTDIAKRPVSHSTVPTVSPAVIRSLYRSLYREVSRLDRNPVLKVLFPCNKDLQTILGTSKALNVPGGKSYTVVLREVFRDPSRVPNINLAFDTLNRLRAHYDNVKAKLPVMERDRSRLLASLQSPAVAARRRDLFRASTIVSSPEARPKYVQAAPGVPSRVVLREAYHSVDLQEGTVLLAHPLSSSYVDRRVMLITERTPIITSAVVLDLQFTYPLSRGNSMFPEVFWGHDVYDGGFSQIGFTMPPTAQIAVLHTLEPSTLESGSEDAGVTSTRGGGDSASSMIGWLKWKDTSNKQANTSKAGTSVATPSAAAKKHSLFCQPLILGGVQDDGTCEPTLYLSKAEALPYLSELAFGQPRSSLRIYWGNMRWTTAQLETEVANGHWMAVKASPSFFRPYSLTDSRDDTAERFPTVDQLAEARQLREKRYGADISPPQVFPPDRILRRRECLWDEIMYAMGGDYAALVGCSNPFSDSPRASSVQILAPHLAPLPLTVDEEVDSAVASGGAEFVSPSVAPLGEEDEEDELHSSNSDGILEHNVMELEEDHIYDGVPGENASDSPAAPREAATQQQQQPSSSAATDASTDAQSSDKAQPRHRKDKNGQ